MIPFSQSASRWTRGALQERYPFLLRFSPRSRSTRKLTIALSTHWQTLSSCFTMNTIQVRWIQRDGLIKKTCIDAKFIFILRVGSGVGNRKADKHVEFRLTLKVKPSELQTAFSNSRTVSHALRIGCQNLQGCHHSV